MGWIAFALKRTNTSTGAELGQIAVIFPKLSNTITMKSGNISFADMVSNPDFPIEAHVFASNLGSVRAKSFGFYNIINAATYSGETWMMNNGSKIVFGGIGNDQYESITFYDKNGKTVYGSFVEYVSSFGSNTAVITWFPCYYENTATGDIDTGVMIGANITDSGISFSRGSYSVPERNYPPSQFQFFVDAKPLYTPKDPYEGGGESGTGGGTGSFSGTGDNIGIPALPTLSAVDAGFITLFNPTLGEMQSLASYMWSDLFDINGWKKIFADPMGAILGLSIVPVNVPAGGSKEVSVGNISTGVSMTFAASQYVEVDCGTLKVEEYWGAYLDYDPYTKAEIYLPYIGIHPIATDDIMGKSVHVVYHVDILSGSCCAYVQCGGTILYSFIGQCSSSIPITGDNWTNVINGAISIAGSIGTMVATGGASAPMAIGNIASTAVNTMKPSVEKSGAMGGTGGMLGVQTPYLILTRPRQALPRLQNTFTGYPAFINELLGDLEGYTEVESIHLENVPATENEIAEIESLLKGGVIF